MSDSSQQVNVLKLSRARFFTNNEKNVEGKTKWRPLRKLVRLLPKSYLPLEPTVVVASAASVPTMLTTTPCDAVNTHEGYIFHQSFNYDETGLQQKPVATRNLHIQEKHVPKQGRESTWCGVQMSPILLCWCFFIWTAIVFVSALVTKFHSFK